MKSVVTKPEFCPNPACPNYSRTTAQSQRWYKKFGFFHTQCRGWIRRFRCLTCGTTCSTQTFSIHYWTHSTEDLTWLLHMLYSSAALRQCARFSGVSFRVIENRIRRLARNSLALMDSVLHALPLSEDLAMDGFESFTRSQYHPNNFTVLVGTRSQFFYAFVLTLLRRKGAMSEEQKQMREIIDSVWQPPPHATTDDCVTMLSDLAPSLLRAIEQRGEVNLYSDKHTAYPAALKRVAQLKGQMNAGTLIHHRISSRAKRTTRNPLFPVNYLDRQIRKNMGEHVRETVKQGREANCQMERMAIFMYMHNFCTPHRIGSEADVDDSPTHAEIALNDSPEIKNRLARMLTHRHIWGHCRAQHEWMRKIWHHQYENPPAVRRRKEGFVVKQVALAPGKLARHFLA